MSFTTSIDVFCDDCSDWTHGTTTGANRRREAWEIAESRGWTKVKGKHLCPLCNGSAEFKLSNGDYSFKEKK